MKRRGFMGGLAALLAAKPKPEDLAKINTSGISEYGNIVGEYASGDGMSWSEPPEPEEPGAHYRNRLNELLTLKRENPEWLHRRRLLDAKGVSFIDADIAVMQSWSLAAKVAAQRQRNYDRALDAEMEHHRLNWQEAVFRSTRLGSLMANAKALLRGDST